MSRYERPVRQEIINRMPTTHGCATNSMKATFGCFILVAVLALVAVSAVVVVVAWAVGP